MNPRNAVRWMIAAALCSPAGALLGCGRDLDTLYGTADAGPPDAGAPELPPFLDVGAFMQQPACKECIEREPEQHGCADKWVACMADPQCVIDYECHGASTDPAKHVRCDASSTVMDDAREWVAGAPPGPYYPLRDCARERCGDECAFGRDFRCSGEWEWEPPTPRAGSELVLTFAIVEFGTRATPEVDVSFCPDGDFGCSSSVNTVTTDGIATAAVRGDPGDGFTGFVRIEVPAPENTPPLEQFPTTYRWQNWPMDDTTFYAQLLTRRGLAAPYWESVGVPYDPERPTVTVFAADCNMETAPGLVVETNLADLDCAPLERCVYYWDGNVLTNDLRETQRIALASANVMAPAGAVDIRLVDTATGRTVASFHGLPPAGSQHMVFLQPQTRTQRKRLEAADAAGSE